MEAARGSFNLLDVVQENDDVIRARLVAEDDSERLEKVEAQSHLSKHLC
jgi:hypothetical protein